MKEPIICQKKNFVYLPKKNNLSTIALMSAFSDSNKTFTVAFVSKLKLNNKIEKSFSKTLTYFRIGLFRASHRWGWPNGSPSLKSELHILQS